MAGGTDNANSESRSSLFANKINIDAFRGISQISLEGLQRVNLLVGGNNSGKTSILEAVSILYSGMDIYKWIDVARMREVRAFASIGDSMSIIDSISWMFPAGEFGFWEPDSGGALRISAETESGFRLVEANFEAFRGVIPEDLISRTLGSARSKRNEEPIEDNGINIRVSTIEPSQSLFQDRMTDEFQIWSQLGYRSGLPRSGRSENFQYLPPYGHRNSSQNLRELSRSARFGTLDQVNALLSQVDDRVRGIEVLTSENGRYPKIAVRMKDNRLLPLAVVGDGLRRALSISLAMVASRNGLLLIDEIEAAFHINAFDRFYNWLVDSASFHNVQIFATTHSLEAIESIARSSSEVSDISAFSINLRRPEAVKRYTGGMLKRLVVDRGLDIRS